MIEALILAAGRSRRLGTPKQLLPFRGAILLQSAVDTAAAAGLDGLVLVLGHQAETIYHALRLPPRTRVVHNRAYRSGQASSLRAGLTAMPTCTRAAVVMLGDQPTVRAASVRAVVEAYRRTGGPVVRARYAGRPAHPVLLARPVWEAALVATGDRGARDILGRVGVRYVDLDGSPPLDVDTWEDYEAVQQLRSEPQPG